MDKAFVDTTILVNTTLKTGNMHDTAVGGLAKYKTTQLPAYALKEFRLGAFRAFCWLHDKFLQTKSVADTTAAVTKLSRSYAKNLPSSVREALTESLSGQTKNIDIEELSKRYGSKANLDYIQADLCRLELKRTIAEAWIARKNICTEIVCFLPCFADVTPSFSDNSFISLGTKGCEKGRSCEIKRVLSKHKKELELILGKIITLKDKRENKKRISAIQEVLRMSTRPFSDNECRDLGDAVFAVLCPNDAEILTTNIADHEPLAEVLGKHAVEP